MSHFFQPSRRSGQETALLGPVPFFDVDSVNRQIDVMGAFGRVLASKHYVLGREVAEFEAAFARFVGVEHCIGVGNGTDALELGLRALKQGPNSRVALVANAAFYGSAAVHAVGAQPVYVDVANANACMDPAELSRVLTREPGITCIIVTHLYGNMADMPAIMALARAHQVPVLEDCAQAHGAHHQGQLAGSWGDVASFSFYPTKNLGAIGDGGAVVTGALEIADRVRALRQYGWGSKYAIAHAGGRNSRLDELQAAVLRDKLSFLNAANTRRREIARAYTEAWTDLPLRTLCTGKDGSVAHLYVVRAENRAALADALGAKGVATAVHYPHPDHLQPAYPCVQGRGTLPVTEAMADDVLSLPCHPGLSDAQVESVIAAVRACSTNSGSLPS